MGVTDGFKGASCNVKVAFALLAVSALFAWIAFTCTGWAVEKELADKKSQSPSHIGLWRICSNNELLPGCLQTDGWAKDWFAACQALVTFGFFGINVALFLIILYMFVPSCQKNREIAMATAIVCTVTGVLYAIGVLVFGMKFKDDLDDYNLDLNLSYCFGLSVAASILEIVTGITMYRHSKQGETSSSA